MTRIYWALVVAIAIGGYAIVIAPAQQSVRETQARAHELYDVSYRNERLIAQASGLRAARRRVESDLAKLAAETGVGKASLALVRELQRNATEHGIVVSALSPEASGPSRGDSAREPVQIVLRGRYGALLDAIAALSTGGVLVEVASADLNGTAGDFGDVLVEATIHATLYHGIAALPAQEEQANAQTAVR